MQRSRFRSLAVVLVVAFLAAACGGNDDEGGGGGAAPVEIKVFAAASLTDAFNKVAEDFSAANSGVKVTYNVAGSQALATQISESAPADVFASADTKNMDKVARLVGTPQIFASNVLQIAVAPGNPKGIKGLADLANPDLKVVLAAEEVPAGKYAKQALDAAKVTVKPVSLEDNVKAVVNKVALGEADAGIVYATDVTATDGKVDGVEIPDAQNVVATYPIATVKASTHQQQAQAFVDFVRGGQGQDVLKTYGFLPPPSA
jgi:molybdate transport system substrate-binding protein